VVQRTNNIERLLAETVNECLRDIMGEKPSRTIGKFIAKRFYGKLGLEFAEKSDCGFVEYVGDAVMKEQEKIGLSRSDFPETNNLKDENNGSMEAVKRQVTPRAVAERILMQESDPAKFYVYCVIPANGKGEFGKIGIGERDDQVYAIDYEDIAAVVSTTSNEKFESSEDNILAHQRVVQRVFEDRLGVPLPFSTIANSQEEVLQLLEGGYTEFRDKLNKLDALASEGPTGESNQQGAKELIEEALSQSADSAVKIRQLNEEINQLRSMRYEKTVNIAVGAMMKRFSAQVSTTLDSLSNQIEGLKQRMQSIQENISQRNITSEEKRYGTPSLDHEADETTKSNQSRGHHGSSPSLVDLHTGPS